MVLPILTLVALSVPPGQGLALAVGKNSLGITKLFKVRRPLTPLLLLRQTASKQIHITESASFRGESQLGRVFSR